MKLFLVLLAVLLAGCASLSEPDSKTSLVIGTVEQSGVGYPSHNGARLNGTHRSGIILTFKNSRTGVKYDVVSRNGEFRSTRLPEGEYRLVNLHLEVKDSSGSNSAGMSLSSKPFVVANDRVSNLGHLVLRMDFSKGLSWEQQPLHDEVRNALASVKTAWNDLEWVSVTL